MNREIIYIESMSRPNSPKNIPEIPVEDDEVPLPRSQKADTDKSFSMPTEGDRRSSMSTVLPELRPKRLKEPSAPKKHDSVIAARRVSGRKNSLRSPGERSLQVSFVEDEKDSKPVKNPMAAPVESLAAASIPSLHSSQIIGKEASKSQKEPIDNLLRFRYLFWGLLTTFVGSSYGTYAIFSLYLKLLYNFSFKEEVDIFVAGTTAGLAFALLAGASCDYFGHRITMGYCVATCFISVLFMGLTFQGNFKVSTPNMSGLFFLMNAGGYGLNVVAIVVVVTHFPRNRGMVCGLYQALGGLAASFYGALFRGFFNSSLSDIFFLCTAVVIFFGVMCIAFFNPAPYVDFRFYRAVRMIRAEGGLLLPAELATAVQKKMRLYFELKVPFLKYRLPRRRARLVFLFLLALNVFMTTQILVIAYHDITDRSTLCIFSAIALVLILLLTVLVWPFSFLDEKIDYSKDSIDIDQRATQLTTEQDLAACSPKVSVLELFRVTRGVLGQNLENSENPEDHRQTVKGAPFPENAAPPKEGQRRTMDDLIAAEIEHLALDNRVAINYDSVAELLKYRNGWLQAFCTVEFWMVMWISFVMWGSGLVMTNNIFIQMYYTGIGMEAMDTKTYYLFSAVSGIFIGSGRMAVGVIADDIMPALRSFLKIPFQLPSTLLLAIPPWIMVLGILLHLAVPGTSGLLAGYIFLSFGFGLITSGVPYIITCFFSVEHVGLGKMYGMCLLAAGIGVVIFYRALFFEEYQKNAFPMDFPLPAARGVCLAGKRDCAQMFLIVTFILNVSAAIVGTVLHVLYQRKVNALAKKLIGNLNTALSSSVTNNV